MDTIKKNLTEAQSILSAFISDTKNIRQIELAGKAMVESIKNGGKIISCGNGGSMCDAMHFAEEMTGRFRNNRNPLPALSISDPSHITCTANDYGFEKVFSRYVETIGKKGDVLLAISTSGNSPNIIEAVKVAKNKGMIIIGLSGKNGGKMSALCDIEIRAPYSDYSDRTQEIHIKVIHCLIDFIERTIE